MGDDRLRIETYSAYGFVPNADHFIEGLGNNNSLIWIWQLSGAIKYEKCITIKIQFSMQDPSTHRNSKKY